MDVSQFQEYRSHKIVRAAKIQQASITDEGVTLILEEASGQQVIAVVDRSLASRHIPSEGDYLVIYADGYQSFSPGQAFEEGYSPVPGVPSAYRKMTGLSFSEALDALRKGDHIARAGWNGKDMWLVLIDPGNAMHHSSAGIYDMQPCIGMKTATCVMQPGWLASQSDMLSDDWCILTESI